MVSTEVARPSTRLRAEDLQSAYLDDVFRYVSAFVRPSAEAEDVTMEVFEAAFSAMGKLRRSENPRLWMLGIARRKVADSLRRFYRRQETSLSPELEVVEASIDQSIVVGEILKQIPIEQAQALVLKYVNELSTEEIARFFDRSLEATNSLLQRARDSFHAKGAPHFLNQEEAR